MAETNADNHSQTCTDPTHNHNFADIVNPDLFSNAGKPSATRKHKKNKQQGGIPAESIPGNRGNENIDDLVKFINSPTPANEKKGKKKSTTNSTAGISLDSSLTSIEWLPKMQIGEEPLPSSTTIPNKPTTQNSSLPITLSTTNIQSKIEPNHIELPTSTVHLKPPYSYVTLIRQAILSASMQRMTLNEIYGQ